MTLKFIRDNWVLIIVVFVSSLAGNLLAKVTHTGVQVKEVLKVDTSREQALLRQIETLKHTQVTKKANINKKKTVTKPDGTVITSETVDLSTTDAITTEATKEQTRLESKEQTKVEHSVDTKSVSKRWNLNAAVLYDTKQYLAQDFTKPEIVATLNYNLFGPFLAGITASYDLEQSKPRLGLSVGVQF